MEGNEIEMAAALYACSKGNELRMNDEGASDKDEHIFIGTSALAFKAGANWQKERENAELVQLNLFVEELKKSTHLLHEAMTSAEMRGVQKGKEELNAELTRANARIEELEKEKAEFRTAFIEYRDEAINLRKMIDLYRKANGQ